jgi:very-short-patch-repair endonuclease
VADFFLSRWAKLYSNPTEAERALEPAIAALGLPYRFNHPLWALRVFPDFVILPLKLVIEVDDPSHNTSKKRKADAERTAKLKRAGWTVVRCTNAEALADPAGTVDRLLRSLDIDPANPLPKD